MIVDEYSVGLGLFNVDIGSRFLARDAGHSSLNVFMGGVQIILMLLLKVIALIVAAAAIWHSYP